MFLPSHEIATSSVWSQRLIIVLRPLQSSRLNSVPSQFSRFRKMGPEPGPNFPRTTCAAKMGLEMFINQIEMSCKILLMVKFTSFVKTYSLY